MHFQTSANRSWTHAFTALVALGLILSLSPQARSEDKKEPTAQESLKQRLKKYEDEAAKLRETMLKECDDEIKKADEALKKAQKEITDAKKDAEARGKAVQAMQKAQGEKSKLQLVRAEVERRILYGVVAPTPVKPPKPKRSELQKLGIHPTAPGTVLVKQLGLEKDQGLVLELIQPNHAAAKAGLQTYDVLVQMDGKPVPSSGTAFRKMLATLKTDTPFDVVVVRGGKKETIKGVVIPGDNDEPKKPTEEPKKPPTDPKKPTDKIDPKKSTDKPKPDPKKPETEKNWDSSISRGGRGQCVHPQAPQSTILPAVILERKDNPHEGSPIRPLFRGLCAAGRQRKDRSAGGGWPQGRRSTGGLQPGEEHQSARQVEMRDVLRQGQEPDRFHPRA